MTILLKQVLIKTPYITLGQFLKFNHIIASGAMAKEFLNNSSILVNDVLENRRGRKLYPGDTILIDSQKYIIMEENHGTK